MDTKRYLDFFKKELREDLLGFWMPRCLDKANGGYFNCFTNDGSRLVSTDKYTWSQGRFLWTFSKLATTDAPIFDDAERAEFLAYAKSGRDFLLRHVLIAPDDYRCVFLMEADGTPKRVPGFEELDMSIFADCFVVAGFAKYALAAGDSESYAFAKRLYASVWQRYMSGNYRSLPYPLSPRYRSHARPMILTNVGCELYEAALQFDPTYADILREHIGICHREVFEVFADERHLVHEFKYADGDFPPDLFGQHINPGHTLEDMWFQLQAQDVLQSKEFDKSIAAITEATFKAGWDERYGGIYHFVTLDGKEGMVGEVGEAADEPQMKLVLDDWGSKLWWVHSEALYTTLLMYFHTRDEKFAAMFEKTFNYVYRTFPNPDRSIGEWIQIRTREGAPQEKVVALPVKDPYHIIRNVILLIELLQKEG